MRPLIGLTLDFRPPEWEHGVSFYRLNEPYIRAVTQAGGTPLALPYVMASVSAYADLLDGLVLTGGPCDVHPRLYGQEVTSPHVQWVEERTAFELALLKEALRRNMPVLGICGGEQVMNVHFGGTLIQHIPDTHASDVEHSQPHSRFIGGHRVDLVPGTLLERIAGTPPLEVNSVHHQAIDRPGEGVVVSARAPDGIIEGIEHPDYAFCMGVQWHPEYHVSTGDQALLEAFLRAADIYKGDHHR